eukprot:gene26889-biopygen5661
MLRETEAEGTDGRGAGLGVSKFEWLCHSNLLTPSPAPPVRPLIQPQPEKAIAHRDAQSTECASHSGHQTRLYNARHCTWCFLAGLRKYQARRTECAWNKRNSLMFKR